MNLQRPTSVGLQSANRGSIPRTATISETAKPTQHKANTTLRLSSPEPVAKSLEFNRIHFSSYSSEWRTPKELFATLDSVYKFTIDVCATPENALVDRYFTKEVDALVQDWSGICWMNPPYGRKLPLWIRKAYSESVKGSCVVCLIPARTDTKWFHTYVTKASDVLFIKGRLTFEGAEHNAPFPSMIVVFGSANPERRIPINKGESHLPKAEQGCSVVIPQDADNKKPGLSNGSCPGFLYFQP